LLSCLPARVVIGAVVFALGIARVPLLPREITKRGAASQLAPT
jgi:hypothetical protein